MRQRENVASACRLLSASVRLCDGSVSESLALAVLPSLAMSEGEVPDQGRLGVEVACEVMAALIPSLCTSGRLPLSILSSALSCIRTLPDGLVSKVLTRLLMPLLGCSSDEALVGILRSILDDLCGWYSAERSSAVAERTLLGLTVLSDHFMDPRSLNSRSDPRLCPQFWMLVQDGLVHRDSVSRKRALYLLKKCLAVSEDDGQECPLSTSADEELLFRWTPHRRRLLREFWEDFVLVMETLEENQVHVVRPVLNRIDTLIQTSVSDAQDSVQGLFHPSWLVCVYQRMFHSENKSLMREGVCHLFQLQLLQQPGFALAFSQVQVHPGLPQSFPLHALIIFSAVFARQFIAGPLMDALSDSSLYNRTVGQSVGDCPELGAKLQDFMVTFFGSLPSQHRGRILLKMIQEMCSKHWCAVPLLFLSQALSRLPPSPLLGIDGLAGIREVLRCTMTTHQVLLRGAAQCFLVNSVLQLTDVSSVTLDDVFKVLMDFRADESLCRGTEMWKQVCVWISDNGGNFKPSFPDTADAVKSETVRRYVQHELETYLRVPASDGQTESLPNPREADKLSRAILLYVDAESGRAGTEISESLESLLSPLLETLSRVSTNIYLPVRKSDKSLQLLLRLFQHGRQQAGEEQDDQVMAVMETLIFRAVDQIQEFILRRLLGELQELCDVERAELYLSVLQQLVVLYRSVPQYHSKLQQSYFPKILNHSLEVLQETSKQVHYYTVTAVNTAQQSQFTIVPFFFALQVNSVANQVAKFVAMASLATVCGLLEEEVFAIQPENIAALKRLNDYFYSQMSSSSECLGSFNQSLRRPETRDTLREAEMLHDWGRVSAAFLRHQWICLSFLIKAAGLPDSVEVSGVPETLKAALSCSVEALALLPSHLVLPVLTFMKTVLPQLLFRDDVLCVEAVSLSWRLVQGLSTNAQDFWPALKGFLSMTFHHQLLLLTDSQAPALITTLRQITSELMELSQSKSGVFGVLLQHCCQLWLPADHVSSSTADTMFCTVFNHVHILTEACVYGPVFRRDQRLIQDVQTYVEQLGEACAANVAVSSDNRDDHQPRTCVLAFLSRLDSSSELHQKLMEKLVLDLLEKENDISQSKVRYYSNSLQHRVKNRVWQTLLLLLPKLKEEFVDTVADRVFEAGFRSNQASVKYLMEWMMILILVYYPHHMDNFWMCLSKDHEKTKTSSCTFLSVLVHFGVIIPKLQDQVDSWSLCSNPNCILSCVISMSVSLVCFQTAQLGKALDVILQWCFNHNFSVRLYALLALKRVWSLAEARAAEGLGGFDGLSTVVKACLNQAEAMQSTGNANKNWVKIQEHFFFGCFHPIRDYSVETIFYTFPNLSDLADDEWIPPWKFENLPNFSESLSLPLKNPASDLRDHQPGDWIQQDKGFGKGKKKKKGEQNKEDRWAEVQKKISPWKSGLQEQEAELQLVPQQRAVRLGKQHGALVVVASLIDKPTNLGGLCRTCEIFGASVLVLDSLHHVRDKHFQSLSVSSELWLPLMEVKPVQLTEFLQVKKNEGYCIVGVEQTANSRSLQDYQFPEKTLLILGNEREGIPANLLQMLDVCVEIPQQGIIRSLNVHVSAALLIWEYTRQHLISG
ncbi:unnamed protein product, partial [Tetraodon nigroviridis]